MAEECGVRYVRDYTDLVADPAVDAVVVVTPPAYARLICLAAVEARKPILVEKPLACTGAEAREIVSAAERAGVPLMMAHTLRFDRAVLTLKARQALAGPRRYLVLTHRVEPRADAIHPPEDYGGRGVLLEVGIHQLDLIRFLTGEEVAEVRCELECAEPGMAEQRALVSLRTTGGLPCVVDVSRVSSGRVGRIEWIGAEALISADWVRHRVSWVSADRAWLEEAVEEVPTVKAALVAFADAIVRGVPVPVTGSDGMRAVEIVDACYESAESGGPVQLAH
jgi:predicted dehydrogenase